MATKQEVIDALNALKADVQAESTVIQSAETLLAGLVQQLKDAVATATDLDTLKTEITDIASQVQTDSTGLSTAIASAPTLGAGSTPTP